MDEAAGDPVKPLDDETFARLYTAQYASYKDDLSLWRALAEEYGSPILEIGCGAGRVLLPLAEAGHAVTGIDINPAMLRRAQGAAAGPHINRFGEPGVIAYNHEENFARIEPLAGELLTPELFGEIRDFARSFLREKRPLFGRRLKEGRIRDCHGDRT